CHTCGHYGHHAKDCDWERRCIRCGEFGHVAIDCGCRVCRRSISVDFVRPILNILLILRSVVPSVP
ncbi:hypothetical protein EJ08DRAFT_589353, partial [Tothia fuscella]